MLLALTGFFWNGCDNASNTVVGQADLGTDPNLAKTNRVDENSASVEMKDISMGIPSVICGKWQNSPVVRCRDGVTCIETEKVYHANPPCNPGEVCAKYGVLIIKKKQYVCDNGKVYNEAEFKDHYTLFEVAANGKIICHKHGNTLQCEDGATYTIIPGKYGNYYSNGFFQFTEEEFLNIYDIDSGLCLYGPPNIPHDKFCEEAVKLNVEDLVYCDEKALKELENCKVKDENP